MINMRLWFSGSEYFERDKLWSAGLNMQEDEYTGRALGPWRNEGQGVNVIGPRFSQSLNEGVNQIV